MINAFKADEEIDEYANEKKISKFLNKGIYYKKLSLENLIENK